jgi:hypothetical protein
MAKVRAPLKILPQMHSVRKPYTGTRPSHDTVQFMNEARMAINCAFSQTSCALTAAQLRALQAAPRRDSEKQKQRRRQIPFLISWPFAGAVAGNHVTAHEMSMMKRQGMLVMVITAGERRQAKCAGNLALDDDEQLPGLINLHKPRHSAEAYCVQICSRTSTCMMTTMKATAHSGALTTALINIPVRSK